MPNKHLIIAFTVLYCCVGLAVQPAKHPAIPWKTTHYSYTARQAPVNEILVNFASAQGIGLNLNAQNKTRLSGDFKRMPSQEFLEKICGMANLVWYYDGAGLYVCSPTDMTSGLLALRYMKADDVIQLLQELDVEDKRFPIARSQDNELIKISGPPRYVQLIVELVQKADALRMKRLSTAEDIRVFPLKHAWADDKSLSITGTTSTQANIPGVASILRQLMGANDTTRTNAKKHLPGDPGAQKNSKDMTPDEKAHKELWDANSGNGPAILADTRLNAVIIRDVQSRMPYYEELIKKLDVPVRMVEISVTVLDINQDSMLDWEMRVKAMGGRKKFSGGAGLDTDNAVKPEDLVGLGLTGSLTYLRKDFSLLTNIAALQEKGKARTVSRPSVLTLDNVAAELRDTKSYRAKVVGTEVVELTEVTAGIVLSVQPRIVDLPPQPHKQGEPPPPTYEIWMLMRIQDGGFESISVDGLPMTRSSTLETQAGVQEGQALLVGGYVHEILEDRTWGIPFLRDIPWIGFLFGGIAKEKSLVQRMFLLSPRVITFGTEDAHPTRGALRQRNMKNEAEIEDAIFADDYRRSQEDKQREQRRAQEEKKWKQDRIDQAVDKVQQRKKDNQQRLKKMVLDEEIHRQQLRQRQSELRRQAELEESRRDMQRLVQEARENVPQPPTPSIIQPLGETGQDEDLKALQKAREQQRGALQKERQKATAKATPKAASDAEQVRSHLLKQQDEQETIRKTLGAEKKATKK